MSKKPIMIGFIVIIVILILIETQTARRVENLPKRNLREIIITAMPFSFTGYTIFLAHKQGYFKDFGLDVTIQKTFSN